VVVAPSHCFRVLARLPPDCRSQHRLIAAPKVSAFSHLFYRNWTRQHTHGAPAEFPVGRHLFAIALLVAVGLGLAFAFAVSLLVFVAFGGLH